MHIEIENFIAELLGFAGCFVGLAGCFVGFAGCFLPPAFSLPTFVSFPPLRLLFAGGATCTLEDSLSGSGMEKGRLQSPFTNLSSSSLISFLFPLYRVQTRSVKDCTCTKAIGTPDYRGALASLFCVHCTCTSTCSVDI